LQPVDQMLFPQVDDYHLAFGLYDRKHGLCFTDRIQSHLLELPKFEQRLEELHDSKEKWLYFFRHTETMDADALPEAFQEPVYRRAAK